MDYSAMRVRVSELHSVQFTSQFHIYTFIHMLIVHCTLPTASAFNESLKNEKSEKANGRMSIRKDTRIT